MIKKIFLLTGIIIFTFTLQAQVAMGKWRTHFAYNLVDQIAQSENKVFAVSEGSLFSIDKRDGSMEFYSKVSGLNGTIISRIEYDEATKTLLIIYQDGNIDFFSADGVKNLPDYYNKQMNADKMVNHILFHDNKAYLSCNFGIIILNMLKMEIQDTYYIGDNASEVKILNTTIQNGNIYAVSETEIFFATASNPHLISYESWSKMSNLPGTGNFQQLLGFGDNLILLRAGKLYKQDNAGTWSDLDVNATYTGIVVSGDYLQGYTDASAFVFDKQLAKSQVTNLNTIKDGIYDNNSKKFWFAGDERGIAEYELNGGENGTNFYHVEGPAVNVPYKMTFAGEKLFVLQGGRWASQYDRPGLVMIYENNRWKNILQKTIADKTGGFVRDFVDVEVDPADNKHFYISSYGTGVYEFKNDEFFMWHTFDNSTIESVYPGNYLYMRVDASAMDKDNNIWFIDSGAWDSKYKVLKNDGTWITMDYLRLINPNDKRAITDIMISNKNPNQKWFLALRHSQGYAILDDNGTLDNTSDDKYVVYDHIKHIDNDIVNVIKPTLFYSIAQDNNGVIWIGTSSGPFLVTNPENAFNPNFNMARVKIPRNDGTNFADYLLKDEEVTAIAIDGANRKWLGTKSSGVYLMSEDGQKTIHHFTTQNSPLLSNEILSIAINPVSGEVFFGTGRGLLSFQSDAAKGSDSFENVYVYPNPVRENFTGLITITGLVERTNVKITDVAGNLIAETTSNGSIATWDGMNKFGQKVSTGVYLAICVSPDGQQSTTSKILVIN